MKRKKPLQFSRGKPRPASALSIRPVRRADASTVRRLVRERWGDIVVAHGVVYHPHRLRGFLAFRRGRPVGLLTYAVAGPAWEIVTLDRWGTRQGIGTVLVETVREAALAAGARRLWLITTNDNLDALRFYQRRGFALVAVRPRAIAAARRLKPTIPIVGAHGIPISDELELELLLNRPAAK